MELGAHERSARPCDPVYPDVLEAADYKVGYTGKGWDPGVFEIGGRTRNPAAPRFQHHQAPAAELDNTLVEATSDNGMPFPRGKMNGYDCGTRLEYYTLGNAALGAAAAPVAPRQSIPSTQSTVRGSARLPAAKSPPLDPRFPRPKQA